MQKARRQFSADEYRNSCDEYRERWQDADQVLYDLTRSRLRLCTDAQINTKLFIIGRVYATGIERQTRDPKPSAIEKLSAFFAEERDRIDALISEVLCLDGPLSPEKLRAIIGIHGRFVDVLQGVTRKGNTPRSFASKYLHFHCPSVPIYDSYAAAAIQKLYRRSSYELFGGPESADEEYRRFVLLFWQLYQDALHAKQEVSVKLLDYYLWYALGINKAGQAPTA